MGRPPDQLAVKVYIQCSCHTLLLFAGDRRSGQRKLDLQGLQHRQELADLASLLALFEIIDQAQPGLRRECQILLRHAHPLPVLPNPSADFLCCKCSREIIMFARGVSVYRC